MLELLVAINLTFGDIQKFNTQRVTVVNSHATRLIPKYRVDALLLGYLHVLWVN